MAEGSRGEVSPNEVVNADPPLAGVRVLDLSRFVAGPYTTMLLADAGARVIKVEPLGGEETRSLSPYVKNEQGGEVSAYFLRLNRSKESLCVDITKARGRDVLLELVSKVDVLVENFRPGVMDKLDLGYERLRSVNNGLVYCSISGFGHSAGPRREERAFAALAEAYAGVVARTAPGQPPARLNVPLGDLYPASLAIGGICMALLKRHRDGLGSHVDIAMYDALVSLNENAVAMWAMTGESTTRNGAPTYAAPFGIFKAQDGWICICVLGEEVWRRFCQAIGSPSLAQDIRFSSGSSRAAHMDGELGRLLDDWLGTRSSSEAVQALTGAGVPAGAVRSPEEVINDPQTIARDMIVRYETPVTGITGIAAGSPIRITGSDRPISAAPSIGQHTGELLSQLLHYTSDEIQRLVNDEVVRI
jgi:CoA:oxalate CoA-transferase